MVFLSNYLVFKIVLAALGRVDYPVAGDLELKYDTANKIYLSGGSLDYVDDATLYTTIAGETTSYGLSVKSDSFINSKQLFNPNAGEKMANDGWYNRRIWANGDGTRFVVLADQYGSYGRVYIYEHSGGSWTQVKYYDKPNQSNSRMSLYCVMNRAGNRIWVDGNPYAYLWERGSSEWPSSTTQAWNDTSNRGLGMNEAGTILTSCMANWNDYWGRTRVRYINSSGNWASTDLNGSNQNQWGFESVLNKEGDILFQTSTGNGTKVWHRTDAYGASWSHVHTPVNTNSFNSNCKMCAISDTGYSFICGNEGYDSSRGRIYFYSYDGNSHPVQLTFIDGENQNDRFGQGVSMSGDGTVAAVGAHSYPSNANDGRVYVYVKSGGSWSLSQTLDKIQSGEKFGSGVALSNDGKTLFVGASENDSGGTNAGCVYVFKKDIYGFFNLYITDAGKYSVDATIAGLNYKTNELEVTTLNPGNAVYTNDLKETSEIDHGTSASTLKACSVSLDGTRVALGATDGRVKVYHLETGVWTLKKEYTKTNAFGAQVCLNDAGTRLFVSDPNDTSGTGKVYVYDYSGSAWGGSETHSWTSPNGSTSDNFGGIAGKGISCNSDGTRLLVVNGYTGSKKGYIFDYTGSSWNTAPTKSWSSGSTWWGITCALNDTGDRAFIGYQNGLDIFHYDGTNWPTSATKNYTGSDYFGASLTINGAGTRLLVGSYNYSSSGGKTDLYDYVGSSWNTSSTQTINVPYGSSSLYGHGINMSRDGKRYLVAAHNSSTYFSSGGHVDMMEDTTGSGSFTLKQVFKPDQASENMGSYQFHEGICLDQKGYTAVILSTGTDVSRIYSSYPIPTLDFDNYNKLSIGNAPTNTSSKLFLGSNVYDIGTLTSDLTIETPGLYRGLVFDTSSNVAYFNKTTVGAIASTMAGYEKQDQVLDAGTNAGYSNGDAAQGGYGNSIDMSADGTRMVVGNAHYTDSNGRVWLYHLESGSWVLKQTWDGGTRLGSQVAMNEAGTRVFAVSPQLDSQNLGFVRIWDYSSGAWDTSASGTYVITPGTINGEVPAVDCNKAGDVVIIGSGNSSNNTWIYRLSGGSWSSEKNFSRRGSGVSMNGDGTRCFMGDRSSHKVWESNYSGGSWGTETEIISESSFSGYWPASLSTDSVGETVCIKGGDSGNGAIYERAGNGSWSASVSGILSKTEVYGADKVALSYDGTMAIFGHTRDSSGALSTGGHALLYTKSGSTWTLTQTLLNPSSSQDSSDFFGGGTGLAKTVKDRFVVAAMGDDNAGTNYGAIYTYTNAIPDFISFDTYNKLSLSGITNPTSKIHALPTGAESTTTYDIGSATNIYIESAGTYTAEMKGSSAFALDSNVVGTVTPLPTTDLDIPGFPTNSAPPRTSIPYTNSIGQTNYTGAKYTLTYNGDVYEITVDSEEQGGATYDPTTSVWARGWHLFTKIITSEDVGGGTTTNFAQYNSANYVTVPAHVKIKLPSAKVAVGGFLRESRNNHITGFKIQGSNNDSVWTDLYTGTTIGKTTGVTFTFSNSTAYQYYRLRVTSLSTPDANTYFRLDAMNIHFFGYVAPPSLNFDTYNKLTFTGADTGSTYKLKYESNTYDLGTISNVYIANPGTYSAEIKGATNFALSSNVTGTVSEPTISGPVSIEWASLNYSNFDGSGGKAAIGTTGGILVLDGTFNTSATSPYVGTAIDITGASTGDHNFKYTIPFKPKSQSFELSFKASQPSSGTTFQVYLGYLTLNWSAAQGWNTSGDSRQKVVNLYAPAGSTIYLAGMTGQSLNQSSYTYDSTKPFVITSDTSTLKIEHNGNSKSIDLTATHEDSSGGTVADPEYYLWMAFDENSSNGLYNLSDVTYSVGGEVIKAFPTLSFDGYNKLSFSNIAPTTSNVLFNGNTYSIGTASNVYIENTGTYEAESKGTTTFALTSNVVSGSITEKPYNATSIVSWTNLGTTLTSDTNNITFSGYVDWDTTGTVSTSFDSTNNAVVFGGGNVGLQADFTSLRSDRNSNLWVEYEVYVTSGDMRSMLGIGKADGGNSDWFHWHDYRVYVRDANVGTGTSGNVPTGQWVKLAWKSDYIGSGNRRVSALLDSGNGYEEIAYHTGAPMGAGSNYLHDTGVLSYIRLFYTSGTTGASTIGNKIRNIHIFYDQSDVPTAPPSLTHDGYKLVVKNITPTSSTLKYESNTYEIGSATNIYVKDTGAYTAEIGGAADFAFTSNTVSGTIKTIEPGFASRYQGSMALTYDGKLYAWGMNDDGEAGVGTSSDITVPTLCTGITQGTVAKLLSSSELTENSRGEVSAIKTTDGKIYMAGKGDVNCIPGKTSDQTSFTDVTSYFGDQSLTANTVTMMSFTDASGAALTETGNVWTWGTHNSTYKKLGQAGASTSSTPKQINFSSATGTITKITCGHYHTVALDSSGDVWFWGKNGINSDSWPSSITDEPQKVVDGKNIIGLASSYGTMYAWDATGKMWNAGNNWEGQIGDGTTTANSSGKTLTEVTYFSSKGITINKVYGGGYFVFADTSDGYYCWGNGGHGVFGNGSTGNITSGPAKWTNVSNIKKFMASTQHTTAITEDGKYYAWGRDYHGSRGDSDSSSDISYPKYIDALPNILAPSFDYDGYDKVFVNSNGLYKYTFELQIQQSSTGIEIREIKAYDSGNNQITITNITSHATFSGSLGPENAYDGNMSPLYTMHNSDNTWSTGSKLFTVTTNSLVYKFGIVGERPQYRPGYNIKYNDASIFTDTSNGGSASNPQGVETDYILGSHGTESETTKYTKGTTTYDAGKASIITVPDPGTYDAQLSQGGVFTLKSATVPATKASGLYTWAFHHGNFDNAYGDGDILTARDNGRFYADTPAYTGTIGTITGSKGVPGTSTQYPNGGWLTSSTSTQYPSINNNGFVTQFTNYYNGANSANYKILDNDDTTATFAPSDQGCNFTYYNNTQKVYIEKVYVDFNTGQPESETIFLREYENDTSTNTSTTSINSRDSSIFKVINSRNVWEITINKALHKFTIDCYNNGNNKMGCDPYNMYWTAYTLGEDDGTMYTFAPPSGGLTANVLMVAGGGSGGSYNTGGGGAGGLVYKQNESISTGEKTIVVGNGGASHAIPSGLRDGLPGINTTFLTYTAIGGGAHGDGSSDDKTGGSGGAGAGVSSSDALQPSSASGGFGNQGGTNDSDRAGGGGGGAGGAGGNGNRNTTAGYGGIGKYYGNFFGNNYGEKGWFAGGGGGGDSDLHHSATRGIGGKGGGGSGVGTFDTGVHGQSHTGGGGGGSGQSSGTAPSTVRGGAGGSGIVLLQTNVATPNANSEVKIPDPDGFLVFDDNINLVSRGPIPGAYNSNTIETVKLPDGSEGPVFYNSDIYTYFGVSQSNTNQGDGSFQTIESVFMPIETGNYTHIASLMYNDSNLMTLGIDGNNKLIIQHNNNVSHNGVTTLTTSDYTMEHGKWHHLVLTTDYLGNAKAYVNGYLVASERWSSMNADKGTAMFYRIGVDNHAERKYMASTSRCYYSELSPKEIMQLASSVGLGPKLEYDGLNTIKILNTEPGSSVKLFTSNVADTSNVFIVADPAAGEYTVPEAGKYYAEIKGTDTFTITKTLDVTGTFPLYQYPPYDGTTSSLTQSASADTWNTWTISGASNGNGQYQAKTTHAPHSSGFSAYRAFDNNIDDATGQMASTTMVNFGITLQLPSAKTIRKYRMYPVDHTMSGAQPPGSSTDPTLGGTGDSDYQSRPNSWVLKGSNDGTSWTDLDTVTNKPISIYGDVYSIDSPASYQYYQMFIVNTVNTASTILRVGEWQLWGDA
ncbi:hypothetical protein N9W82_00190 [Candidatus Pelagibacter bacterium]|nr:hypothetical protein [Candidatus Pelagibacter bacterium]